MAMPQPRSGAGDESVLPEDVPVAMPELPARLSISTAQQFRAIGDRTRWRILSVIQYQPATARQIADRLKRSPGSIGHHLQVLEAAGLVQVVARRLVHGIIAKYYTRTARIFMHEFPPEVTGSTSTCLQMLTGASQEYAETLAAGEDDAASIMGFPRARLSPERLNVYHERLKALVDDFLNEAPDPGGQIYSLCFALFKAPPYLQVSEQPSDSESSGHNDE